VAIGELAKHGGKVFDQDLIVNFRGALLGAAKPESRRMSSSSFHVPSPALIVDSNPEETNALEFLMTDQGFDVRTARSLENAHALLGSNGGGFHLVISELDMPDGDGLELLESVRKQPWGKDLPWIVLTKRQGGKAAQRSFALGVMDFMAKPVSTDLVVAKSRALLDKMQKERVVKGVSGSLSEMSLGDIVQVLFYGKKTGKLTIRTKSVSGEVHFTGGNIVDATWGPKGGKDAFYAMVRFSEGTFAFDPTFVPTTKVIEESNESLLLEGLRRMDEGIE
jgi:DNA-binding response OmpR family regulator